MEVSSSQTLEQCIQQLNHYGNVPRLRNDVQQLMARYRTIRPAQQSFTAPNGESVKLFYLSGTIPVGYRGASYNIPLTVYFDPPYPLQPPRCFVSPTAGMVIKENHSHVDRTGMVYLPYLNQWNAYQSTLGELFQAMSDVFSQSPPVYSTRSSTSNTQSMQTGQSMSGGMSGGMVGTDQLQRFNQPVNQQQGSFQQQGQQQNTGSFQQMGGGGQQRFQQQGMTQQSFGQGVQQGMGGQQMGQQMGTAGGGAMGSSMGVGQGTQNQGSFSQGGQQMGGQQQMGPGQRMGGGNQMMGGGQMMAGAAGGAAMGGAAGFAMAEKPQKTPEELEEEHRQKVNTQLVTKAKAALPVLLRPILESVQEQLDVGEKLTADSKACDELEELMERELETQERILITLEESRVATEAAILKAEQSKDFDVDEFLEPSDVLSRQLLDLVAEENAYDDCIELLSNALQERSIATEDWLFEVRDCYKKQFFCRELQKKVVRVLKARKLAKATTGL